MKWFLGFITLLGISFSVWACLGVARYVSEKLQDKLSKRRAKRDLNDYHDIFRADNIKVDEVAVVVPAYNEELTIARTLRALKRIVPAKNIHVGSDSSTDRTVKIASKTGCQVFDLNPNRGKAGVIDHVIRSQKILDRYKAVLIVDADSEIDQNYLTHALPIFNDPTVASIAGHVISKWHKHNWLQWSSFFSAYRTRLYRILQLVLRYGQTWKHANVTTIAPGFVSIYRTEALRKIEINAPGLVIEDYNMTFETHAKKLGRIAYSPKIFGVTDDPHTLKDYRKQVRRWNLGFWQTMRRHGFWVSFFSLSNGIMLTEMIIYSLFFISLPLIIFWFATTLWHPLTIPASGLVIAAMTVVLIILSGTFLVLVRDYKAVRSSKITAKRKQKKFARNGNIILFFLFVTFILIWHSLYLIIKSSLITNLTLSITDILIGVLLADYLLTIFVTIIEKKPKLLVYGLGFALLRYLDAFLFLYTIPLAFRIKSDGRWVSPKRRVMKRAAQ